MHARWAPLASSDRSDPGANEAPALYGHSLCTVHLGDSLLLVCFGGTLGEGTDSQVRELGRNDENAHARSSCLSPSSAQKSCSTEPLNTFFRRCTLVTDALSRFLIACVTCSRKPYGCGSKAVAGPSQRSSVTHLSREDGTGLQSVTRQCMCLVAIGAR